MTIELRHGDGEGRGVFAVTDTGVGIKQEDRARIFEPFEQITGSTSFRSDSSGLGLHLSRRLATLIGGRLEFDSEYGKGSTFRLALEEL